MKAYGWELKQFINSLPDNDWVEGTNEDRIEDWNDLDDFTKYDTLEIGCEVIWRISGDDEISLTFDTELRKWKKNQSHIRCIVSVPKDDYDFVVSNIKNLKIKGLTIQKV